MELIFKVNSDFAQSKLRETILSFKLYKTIFFVSLLPLLCWCTNPELLLLKQDPKRRGSNLMSHTVYQTPKSVTSFQCLIPVLVLQVLEWNVLQLSPLKINSLNQPTDQQKSIPSLQKSVKALYFNSLFSCTARFWNFLL